MIWTVTLALASRWRVPMRMAVVASDVAKRRGVSPKQKTKGKRRTK